MKWSAKLGRFAGIDVYLHASFALLLVWVAWVSWRGTETVWGVAGGIGLVLALFLCVLLHEYGHALTARRYGIGTKHITLLPFGGVALLERLPARPSEEVWIALAGPFVNLAIAAVLWMGYQTGLFPRGGILGALFGANLALAGFNLLPAFPMDGGRILRALLTPRMGLVEATRVASRIGRVFAILLGLYGAYANPVLVLIAGFVWYAGGAEMKAVEARERRRAEKAAAERAARETADA